MVEHPIVTSMLPSLYLLGGTASAIAPIATDVSAIRVWSVRLSVTFMHPAEAVGRNETPFGRDTHVAPSNIVLDAGPGAPQDGEIWRSEPPTLRSVCHREK